MEINANSFYAHKNIRPLSTKEQSDYLPLTPLTPQNTMKYGKLLIVLALAGLLPLCTAAQDLGNESQKVTLHGSIQSDILVPQEDESIGTGSYDNWALTNTYADLYMMSRYVDAGARLEFTQFPLPGFEPEFQGWGVPHIYIKGKLQGAELTVGDMYDQFGSGLIFRTYEERSLGIDNALRGARLNLTAIPGVQWKVLGGVQRTYWNWNRKAWVAGTDAEMNIDHYSTAMQERGITWMVGGSYVLKHEADEDIIVPGTNLRLNLPTNIGAFDVRSRFQMGNYSLLAEYAWKGQDPSFDNGYTYHKGQALMLSGSYSTRGLAILLQAKRSDNMAYRSQRSREGMAAYINHMPAFAYQHTYALPALYPYATQNADGEWAFQGEASYTFKRKTALGGKYGTKVKLNMSHIRALDKHPVEMSHGTLMGTDGYTGSFFKMGKELYYQDINLQLEKRITKDFKLNAMYMNQHYNQTVVEGEGGMIRSHIGVLEGQYKINSRYTLRSELQYLSTRQDEGDWCYALVELSALPYLMFTVSDMWNCGVTNLHYYMGSVTFNYEAHRLMLSYGRTRAGFNCAGGVCRYVPASRGVQLSYNYNF